MQNQQYPNFNPSFDYLNIGNFVGTLVYAKELEKKDGTPYGHEFLVNVSGYGSVNVRIPMIQKSQNSLDKFPVSEKPRVRAGLSRLEQFTSDEGRTYTNTTTFIELSPAVTVAGEDMKDNAAGRLSGEVFNLREENGVVKFSLVSYPVNKDDKTKRATDAQGTPVDPQVIALEVHEEALLQQARTLRNGMNLEVGYRYFNKSEVTYDEFGYATQGDTIERVEVGKFNIKNENQNNGGQSNPPNSFGNQGGFGNQQQNNPNPNQGFGNQQQQNGFGQQQNNQNQGFGNQGNIPQNDPFANQQGQQNDPFANQQQPQNDPFAQGTTLQPNDPAYQEAQNLFGGNQQSQQQNGGFGFGN
jgi:hypothetical protein